MLHIRDNSLLAKYSFIFLLLLYNWNFCHCLKNTNFDRQSKGVSINNNNNILDLFSNAISSVFSSKTKRLEGKQAIDDKVDKSIAAEKQGRDSLFLYPLAQATGDQCDLPQVIGTGPYRIPRWYFNPNTQKCSLFYYSGCCGNGNNFPTLQSCQVLCESDPCVQPKDSGVGSLQVPRYYFNKENKMCDQYLYYGSGGNRNSFSTISECRSRCPENPNPCAFGEPSRTSGSGVLQCTSSSQCPTLFYCHIGSSPSTTICCPKNPNGMDQCLQPAKHGIGNELFQRWFFDSSAQSCTPLEYHGLQGNENNFISKDDCENACFTNPCETGRPFSQGTAALQCSANKLDVCPQGYFCHVGYEAKTTVCCPSQGNACKQKHSVGKGNKNFNRWFFNEMANKCETFSYSGSGGNENNFLSEEKCKSTCQTFVNVCSGGHAAQQKNSPSFCENDAECPSQHWCHFGGGPETTMCCPKAHGDICKLPLMTGKGVDALQRWYFDPQQNTCARFIYAGQMGNQNNFRSLRDCQNACPDFINPCPVGGIAYQPDGESSAPVHCKSSVDQCPSNSWCHIGEKEDTTVCCIGRENPCEMNIGIGSGDKQLPRWFFNKQVQACQQFSYSGIKGNQNNFLTKEACESKCRPFANPCYSGQPQMDSVGQPLKCSVARLEKSCAIGYYCHLGGTDEKTVCCPSMGNPCDLAMSSGSGQDNLQRFYYNPMTKQCLTFVYKGTKGNDNNFLSELHCSDRCPVFVNPCLNNEQSSGPLVSCMQTQKCPANYWCHHGSTSETTVCCQSSKTHRCELPMNIGQGLVNVPRWYFKSDSKECVVFQYKGILGNANNFLTKEECERECPTFVSICATGQPFLMNNKPQLCGPSSNACPSDYWCHVGATLETTMCCPGAKNPCDIPYTAGIGTYNLQRWYYDYSSRSCMQFEYRGTFGNTNNFLTKSDCDKSCQTWINPCTEGTPAMGPNSRPQICNPKAMLGSCPPHYWCHVGGSAETTACCPGDEDTCVQPQNVGTGSLNLQRWYFDKTDYSCKLFIYKGIKGNQNNFLTKESCEKECPVFVNPCPDNQNRGQMKNCNPLEDDTCPSNFWCHVGASEETTVCCQGSASPCSIPPQEGTGNANLQRWFFDSLDRTCKQFIYKGTKGNQNNFLTQQHCIEDCPVFVSPCQKAQSLPTVSRSSKCNPSNRTACYGSEYCHVGPSEETTVCCPGGDNRCSQLLNPGIGDHSLSRWYYDQKEKNCKPFTYKGLKGNQNNFLTYEICATECPVFMNPCPDSSSNSIQLQFCDKQDLSCPSGHWCHKGVDYESTVCCANAYDPCVQSKAIGLGKFSLPRFYYDAVSQQCAQFTYSGMRGNQNNFLTIDDCERQCREIPNPCRKGELLLVSGVARQCNPLMPCPKNYWCHIGSAQETTTCCETENEDSCVLNLEFGVGKESLIRWYFNALTKQCIQFTYRGTKGNQNNFLTQMDCERSCRIFTNPCPQGEPFINDNGAPVTCAVSERNVCPQNYWCHYGDSEETTICCQMNGENPCEQPMHVGSGRGEFSRFYFNPLSRSCFQFTYHGSKGNQNNFRTLEECQNACPVTPNPCREGSPLKDPSGRWQQCITATAFDSCGPGYWCHYGATAESTVCCPGSTIPNEICPLAMLAGSGNATLPRWGFNPTRKQCSNFNYQGLHGNQNNFQSKPQCEKTCPVFQNPCAEGEPVKDHKGTTIFCSADNQSVCPRTTWCHIGLERESTLCCPGAVENPCTLRVTPGTGQYNVTRWCFDNKSSKCKNFHYTGLGGNQNNFVSREECTKKCHEFPNPCPTGEPAPGLGGNPLACTFTPGCGSGYWCHLGAVKETTLCCLGSLQTACSGIEPNEGAGDQSLSRWFYDAKSRQCNMFIYKGMRGNPNNFFTRSDCESTCKALQNPCNVPVSTPTYCSPMSTKCSAGEWCHFGDGPETSICCPGAAIDACVLPMITGSGNSSLPRFYFNAASAQCLLFTYRGLNGNQNNFLTKAACEAICSQYPNPCPSGSALMRSKTEPQTCNGLATASSCPSGHWCHVGSSLNTTVCCPGTSDPCKLSVEPGVGDASLPRWYFDSNTKKCSQFTYNGLKGNQNNFVSLDTCHVVCREFINPCIGQPATTPTGHVVFCSVTNKDNCPVNFWCHIGSRPETTLCCPGATNPCSVPMAPGTGAENMTRWYYNADTRQCVQFVYNGIGGNQNNFFTKGECESTCPAQLCALSVDPGTCSYNRTRFAYDRQKRTCISFTYGGCGGNLNNFAEMDDCLSVCGRTGYRKRFKRNAER